jgi:epsilon-lactone hydrolase
MTRAQLVHALVNVALKPVLGPPMPLGVQRAWLQLLSTGAAKAGRPVTVGGRPAERHGPLADASVLLLHGGGFVTGGPRTHRVLGAQLAAAAGLPVVALDYRRAPERPWPAAVEDAVAAYDELAACGPVAVVGDSAGGTLALLLVRVRRPVALGLISPLVDLTAASSRAYSGRDALLRQDWLERGTRSFLGGADARELSPLHGELAGLPPVLVHVSEHERLRGEGEHLVERVRAAGGHAELVLLAGLWHDVHLFGHLLPEAAAATADLGRWLRAHLDAAASGAAVT